MLLPEGTSHKAWRRGGCKEANSAGEVGPTSVPAGPPPCRQPTTGAFDLLPKLEDFNKLKVNHPFY